MSAPSAPTIVIQMQSVQTPLAASLVPASVAIMDLETSATVSRLQSQSYQHNLHCFLLTSLPYLQMWMSVKMAQITVMLMPTVQTQLVASPALACQALGEMES